jgi:hypothetical protein
MILEPPLRFVVVECQELPFFAVPVVIVVLPAVVDVWDQDSPLLFVPFTTVVFPIRLTLYVLPLSSKQLWVSPDPMHPALALIAMIDVIVKANRRFIIILNVFCCTAPSLLFLGHSANKNFHLCSKF